MNNEQITHTLNKAYIALMTHITSSQRVGEQALLIELRDTIAELSGKSSKDVQDAAESESISKQWEAYKPINTFMVRFYGYISNKKKYIKLISEITGMNLVQSKCFVENPGRIIRRNISAEEAGEIYRAFCYLNIDAQVKIEQSNDIQDDDIFCENNGEMTRIPNF